MSQTTTLSAIFITGLLATGCASQQIAGSKLTEAQQQQIQQCKKDTPAAKKIRMQAVTTGCLATLAFWKAIGQDNPAALICAAGGGPGFLIGDSIAERKCEYAVLENQVEGEIAHAGKLNGKFTFYFLDQEMQLAKQKGVVKSLTAMAENGDAKKSSMEGARKSLNDELTRQRNLLLLLKQERGMKLETLSLAKTEEKDLETIRKLLAEIKALTKNIERMQKNSDELAQLNATTNDLYAQAE